ncbi:Uncharacterised protein [Chlamydia trachomatis]|nr:Uncharacterised protein [Chlamydia trachomatis]
MSAMCTAGEDGRTLLLAKILWLINDVCQMLCWGGRAEQGLFICWLLFRSLGDTGFLQAELCLGEPYAEQRCGPASDPMAMTW